MLVAIITACAIPVHTSSGYKQVQVIKEETNNLNELNLCRNIESGMTNSSAWSVIFNEKRVALFSPPFTVFGKNRLRIFFDDEVNNIKLIKEGFFTDEILIEIKLKKHDSSKPNKYYLTGHQTITGETYVGDGYLRSASTQLKFVSENEFQNYCGKEDAKLIVK